MQVETVTNPGSEWDAFAESGRGACLGHAAAWAGVLQEAYGLTAHYLAARDANGELAGILPLVRFRTLRGDCELHSLPYLDAAGILARDAEVERMLLDAALDLTGRAGGRALELRQARPLLDAPAELSVDRVNLTLSLESDAESQWKALRAKVRNQTRKAEREGLALAKGSPDELLKAFYEPFGVNMRDLGSPVHDSRFFHSASRHFGHRLRFIVARLGDRPVGGLVAIRYANAVTVPWASSLRSERRRCTNNLIYWEAIRWAIAEGAREFDFGRSPQGSGTHRFKLGWGAREEPLAWLRLNTRGRVIPVTVGRRGPVLGRLSNLWSYLPVPLANALGPRLRRYFSN